jgi:MEMO1 family protein
VGLAVFKRALNRRIYMLIMHSAGGNSSVRSPAVAGQFYPDDPGDLRATVRQYLEQVQAVDFSTPPRAFIVPHAGYVYSGCVAAWSYALIAAQRNFIRRVVLIGPSHYVRLRGAAVPEADVFRTPLGDIAIDRDGKQRVRVRCNVGESDAPHAMEHSLEVQLPFLQETLEDFTLLPIVVGSAPAPYVSSILDQVWGGNETLVLASSDLSHYHAYARAQAIDAETNRRILKREPTLSGDQACGAVAINGLLQAAVQRGLEVRELARLNSGDTAGDRSRVVGYGAYAIHA